MTRLGYLPDPADPANVLPIAGPVLPDLPSYWLALVLEDLATQAAECDQQAAAAREQGNHSLASYCQHEAKVLRRVHAAVAQKIKFCEGEK